jgi:hypothetical protein
VDAIKGGQTVPDGSTGVYIKIGCKTIYVYIIQNQNQILNMDVNHEYYEDKKLHKGSL